MKTIYDLTIGDSYYVPLLSKYTETMENPMFWKPTKNKIRNEESLILFNGLVSGGKAFLTEQDCQKSIDYDVAMAKIQKFVSEFSDEPDTMSEIIFNSHPQEIGFYISERNGYITQASPLVFKTKNALRVLEELPEEVKIVLGVK